VTKTQRQHWIAQALATQTVTSQGQLVALLREDGIEATQATVSRDLVELGAVKVRLPGGRRAFALPEAASRVAAPPDQLRRVLNEWVVEVASAGPIVVVKTPPGCAHVVASALDRGVLQGTLGTVAGDDTIFVVVDERIGGAAVAASLRELAGLSAPPQSPNAGRTRRAAGAPARRSR
jgi:transcriptional regulator of arginine metabolism